MISSPTKKAPPWLWPNLLGLDAPIVAVTWQYLFTKAFSITLPPVFHLILFLSAWVIYLADRLVDSIRAKNIGQSPPRLRFTKTHFKPLAALLFIVSAVNFTLIIQNITSTLLITGLATAALLALYYIIRFSIREKLTFIIPREILCGMLFAVGCVIAPHSFSSLGSEEIIFIIATLLFGAICSINCIQISLWEHDADLANGDKSIANTHSEKISHLTNASLFIPLCMILAYFSHWQIFLAITLSAIALRLLLRFQEKLSQNTLRTLADAVLLTPWLLIPFT
ncbi:MAG: hypothetical protein ACSHX7_09840 [Luteolibacter sp.]